MDLRRKIMAHRHSDNDIIGGGTYHVILDNQWRLSETITNPNNVEYDGVYESFSNYHIDSEAAFMYIDIVGFNDFKLYIRSHAESTYDYVMVSQLDKTINNNTNYSDTTLVKAHTSGEQNPGDTINDYQLVEFTNIDEGIHRITIVYRKDGSQYADDDRGYVIIPKNQGVIYPKSPKDYLGVYALEDGLSVSFTQKIQYSVDNAKTWSDLVVGQSTPAINSGEMVLFKGENLTIRRGIGTFSINKQCRLRGNCMSMLFGDNAKDNFSLSGYSSAFYNLFSNCVNIVSIEENFLPATTLDSNCYYNMFGGCTNLTNAPALPATTLASYCYYNMFYKCTSLTNAPALPATTLASYCYNSMFYGCNNLTNAPALPATTLADNCYGGMFYGCTNLTNAPALPATTLAGSCYRNMFYNCNNLTNAPALPATTLASYCYYNMFYNCTRLTNAPALPATTLASYCYYNMFYNCYILTNAPALPATTLADSCYRNMFYNCYGLTTVPENLLPATTLASYCYNGMFSGCTRLTNAPALPATTLADYCYYNMFYRCGSLTNAPALPATTLASNCYNNMFTSCISLTNAPALPATTLADYCYNSMFGNCTSLTTAPVLPATTLVSNCYNSMFYGCTRLKEITMLATDISATNCMSDWVASVASTGTFYKNMEATWDIVGDSGVPSGWTIETVYSDAFNKYLIIEAIPDEETPRVYFVGSEGVQLQYSRNGLVWEDLSDGEAPDFGDSSFLMFKCTNITPDMDIFNFNIEDLVYGSKPIGIGRFDISGKAKLKGNCMSLVYGDNADVNFSLAEYPGVFNFLFANYVGLSCDIVSISKNFLPATELSMGCYRGMFGSCTSLTEIPENLLPATTLASYCYYTMFSGCTSLTTVPAGLLPATTSAEGCYYNMFSGCTSLTTVPAGLLPATTLADGCYYTMFYGCTSLTEIPENLLPATTLAEGCYSGMFYGCTGLITVPENLLPATTLADGCYFNMFINCTSLIEIPENLLPATTLTYNCYSGMFSGCTSLTTVPAGLLPATTLAEGCYSGMFYGCTGLITVPENLLPATTLADYCYSSMFYGCTNLLTTPYLPAPILVSNCYNNMFNGCSSVSKINAYANTPFGPTYTSNWVKGVQNTGIFVCGVASVNLNSSNYGDSYIPSNWTKMNQQDNETDLWRYLVIRPTVVNDNSATTVHVTFNMNNGSLQYAFDLNRTWQTITSGRSYSIPAGHYMMVKGNCTASTSGIGTIQITGTTVYASVEGNCMALLNNGSDHDSGLSTGRNYAFVNLFQNSDRIIDASRLSIPLIGQQCCQNMFINCYNLVSAPEIMFGYIKGYNKPQSLVGLANVPIQQGCYSGTFQNCFSLRVPPKMLTSYNLQNGSATGCYSSMFYNCRQLLYGPKLPATRLVPACYSNMFRDCVSLVKAPELPSLDLYTNCYQYMFYGCSNLNKIKALFTSTPTPDYTSNWVSGVASEGTFIKNKNATWEDYGDYAVPANWKIKKV